MSFPLAPEQTMLVESVRAFVEKELYPHEDLVEKLDDVPEELARDIQMKALKAGFYAANMPAEHGGGGLDALSLALMERELGRAGYALQMCVCRPSNILQGCEGEQIERYLIPTIKGERHDCLAMTEPGAGSDVRSMKTRAERKGDGYIINGAKHFISHADKADFVILFAATRIEESAGRRRGGNLGFPHRRRRAGIHGQPRSLMRLQPRLSSVRTLFRRLLRAWVAIARRRGTRLRSDERVARRNAAERRRNLASAAPGVCWRARSTGPRPAVQFGEKIGRFQGVSFQLADMATEIEASDLLTLSAAHKVDQGTARDQDFAMAKLFASETLGPRH